MERVNGHAHTPEKERAQYLVSCEELAEGLDGSVIHWSESDE
jgi:hypothetical protein